jgi:hypothetical protein
VKLAQLSPMPVHSTGEPASTADYAAAEQVLLTIGRAGVRSSRAMGAEELDTLLRLLEGGCACSDSLRVVGTRTRRRAARP